MIKPATFNFLRQLAQNNSREWFLDNKLQYDEARENVVDFAAALVNELQKTDPGLDSDPKKCVMRIYRDIRFSKDKTLYKDHFGIGKLLSGIKADGMGFYIHIQPDQSFAGGGYWMPEAAHLKQIRQEIDYNAASLKDIIDTPDFKKLFGEFRDQDKLKTIPRDYDALHPDIELLKLKSFVAMNALSNEQLTMPDAAKYVAGVLGNIRPLTEFLNNAIA